MGRRRGGWGGEERRGAKSRVCNSVLACNLIAGIFAQQFMDGERQHCLPGLIRGQ
jgi:hypothetical protein